MTYDFASIPSDEERRIAELLKERNEAREERDFAIVRQRASDAGFNQAALDMVAIDAKLKSLRAALLPLANGLINWPHTVDSKRDIGRMNYDTGITVADVFRASKVVDETDQNAPPPTEPTLAALINEARNLPPMTEAEQEGVRMWMDAISDLAVGYANWQRRQP